MQLTTKIPLTCYQPSCLPNYKQIKTSYNDPKLNCVQNYSNVVKFGSRGYNRCYLNSNKNPNTGLLKPQTVVEKTIFIKNIYPMQVICSKTLF